MSRMSTTCSSGGGGKTPRDQSTRAKGRWQTKREKERNKARFLIRERIARQVRCPGIVGQDATSGGSSTSTCDGDQENPAARNTSSLPAQSALQQRYVHAIESGSVSTFSLRNLEAHRRVLSQPVPIDLLSPLRLREITMSRFGQEYRDDVLQYLSSVEEDGGGGVGRITMMEYASLLGEYDVVKAIVVGGYNLVRVDGAACGVRSGSCDDVSNGNAREGRVVQMVYKRLHLERIPLTLTAYIVKAISETRMWGWVRSSRTGSGESSERSCCPKCKDGVSRLLNFGGKCKHSYCELCIWEDMIGNIDERQCGDVVLCPICAAQYSGDNILSVDSVTSTGDNETSPADRLGLSLDRYNALPESSKELQALRKKGNISRRKQRRNTIHCTWYDAIVPTLGSSKEVRRDRYFRYAESGDINCIRCCLEAGVEVNMVNEYYQTPLYVACWRGHTDVVKMLLGWGGDPSIAANGNMTCYNAAQTNGKEDIATLLESEVIALPLKDRLILDRFNTSTFESACEAHVIIDVQSDHPGAGAFYIDTTFPAEVLLRLDALVHSLPVDSSEKTRKQKKTKPCSKRSYICDAEGGLRTALADIVRAALTTKKCYAPQAVYVFPHMRFLNYDEPSGWLAPHTDLSRTESLSGRKSTHTFILYLTDCDEGGETALLSDAVCCEVIAKVEPRRGRLFLFPHECPHEGMDVISTPKLLLRGEAMLEF